MRPARTVLAALLVASASPGLAAAHGGGTVDPDRWWAAWQASPLQLAPIAVGLGLYLKRARTLGPRLPAWRSACFLAGVFVIVVALVSPIDAVGENGLFSVHMAQHMLLGDLAPLLVMLGITGPVLRPALARPLVQRLRILTHPVWALAIWTVLICGWHAPVLYEAAVRNDLVHALEHASFFTAGALMWGALIETLPGPEWFGTGAKLGFVGAVRVVTAVLGNIFWWSGTALYGVYADDTGAWGLSPLEDQAMAGTVMMAYTGLTTLAVAGALFFRMAGESELRQRLLEAGVEPGAARRAVRYGRGEILAARHGLRRTDP